MRRTWPVLATLAATAAATLLGSVVPASADGYPLPPGSYVRLFVHDTLSGYNSWSDTKSKVADYRSKNVRLNDEVSAIWNLTDKKICYYADIKYKHFLISTEPNAFVRLPGLPANDNISSHRPC